MKPDLKVTLIQSGLHWENREANLRMFSEKIESVTEETDLIVLPEMFTTGFSMRPEQLAENMDGAAMNWMKSVAAKQHAALCGSMMMREDGKFFNRLIFMRPDGSFESYDKRHLFGLGEENQHYARGNKKILLELKGWKILPLICYDLRFPVWSRNSSGYDLLLYVANWPERRIHAWKTLLVARAIENECYTIGVNRVGDDGNHVFHSGESAVIDARGNTLWQMQNEESIYACTLSPDHLDQVRQSLPFLQDADQFELK